MDKMHIECNFLNICFHSCDWNVEFEWFFILFCSQVHNGIYRISLFEKKIKSRRENFYKLHDSWVMSHDACILHIQWMFSFFCVANFESNNNFNIFSPTKKLLFYPIETMQSHYPIFIVHRLHESTANIEHTSISKTQKHVHSKLIITHVSCQIDYFFIVNGIGWYVVHINWVILIILN